MIKNLSTIANISAKIRKNSLLASAVLLSSTASFTTYAQTEQQQALYDIAKNVSAENIEKDITTLVNFGTRHTLSETESDTRGIGAARRWIKSEFDKISAECGGCLEVYYQSEVISGEKRIPDPVEVVSVIAIQRGTTDPNRYVIMSGDIDSRVSDVMDFTSDSPGANDNASGVAGALEAARVLSKYKFNGSIVYAALSGEEQGLFGGRIMANQAKKDGWRIKAVLNNDMIGNIEGVNGVINNTTARLFAEGTRVTETEKEARMRRFTGGEVDSPSRNLARYIDNIADKYIENLDTMVIYRLDRFGRGGVASGFHADPCPAAVAVAPLHMARGVQNKVLEAMAMARPVVLTPGAATGIGAEDGNHFAIAHHPPGILNLFGLRGIQKRTHHDGITG